MGTKRGEFGRRDWNVCERPQTLLSLPPSLPSLSPSSLHLFLSFQQTAGAEPQQSHSSLLPRRERRGKAVWLQLDLRVIWRTQPGKAETGSIFSSRQGTRAFSLPLPQSPHSPLPFFHTTAKSIEMTTQLEGHSWARWALWWNALRYEVQRTNGKTNPHPASAAACLSCSDPAGGNVRSCYNPSLLPIHQHAKMELSMVLPRRESLTEDTLFP